MEDLKAMRDEFALKAMEMYFNKTTFSTMDTSGNVDCKLPEKEFLANFSYEMADAMIKARNA